MQDRSPPPFALEGIDHVVLLVADMARAEAFYRDVIGCAVEQALPQYGMLQLRAGAALIDLIDTSTEEGAWGRPDVAGGRNMDHVCLATGPWDESAMRTHLAAHGVEIIEEGIRSGARGDGLSFYVRDPDGNQIELKARRQQAEGRGVLLPKGDAQMATQPPQPGQPAQPTQPPPEVAPPPPDVDVPAPMSPPAPPASPPAPPPG